MYIFPFLVTRSQINFREKRSIVSSSETTELEGSDKVHFFFSNAEIRQSYSGSNQVVANSAVLEVAVRFCRSKLRPRREQLTFTAYQLTKESDFEAVIAMDTRSVHPHELLAAANATDGHHHRCGLEWIRMDITPTVQTWLLASEKNYGLVVDCDGCSEQNLHLDGTYTRLDIDTDVFSHGLKPGFVAQYPERQPKHSGDCQAAGGGRRGRCCRASMTVDLTSIDSFQFIVQPKTFDAHLCRGRCPPRFNPTNDHSLLQSLLHLKTRHLPKGQRVPRPCCAPTKMLPLDILHLDPNDNTRLKVTHWKDVIVAGCGCS